MHNERRRLGRGLSTLLGAEIIDPNLDSSSLRFVAVDCLRPNEHNPRNTFTESDLHELAESIKEKGILQPIMVRQLKDSVGYFGIIAGERRWRAAQLAGLQIVPVIVREVNDQEALELAIIENVQRTDLSPLEEAAGYQQLIEEFAYTQQNLAQMVGKSRSYIANTLRLLKLPDSIKAHLQNGNLTAGHVRAMLNEKNPEELALRAINEQLSVREVEAIVKEPQSPLHPQGSGYIVSSHTRRHSRNEVAIELERAITKYFDMKVAIKQKQDGSGSITFSYNNEEQLHQLISVLQSK